MAKKKVAKKKTKVASRTPARRPAARKTARKTKKAPAMDHDAMMAKWQKAMTPADGHARLEPMVGIWHATTTFTMTPGAPPQVTEGRSEHRWALGGRFLEQRYKGISMGMPFEGVGYTGYDNVQRRYVGTWMDTFGTGFMSSVGVGRPTDEKMEFEAEAFEPSGKRIRFWTELRVKDRNRHSFAMWTKAPNGRRYRTMLVEYTRA